MAKFSFKMKDRMKLVVERPATNSCTLTVSGKKDVVFRFSKKRAADLVKHMQSVITYGVADKFVFNKTAKAPAGSFELLQPTTYMDAYCLTICEGDTQIFHETGISKKQVKKMIKVFKEVYGL